VVVRVRFRFVILGAAAVCLAAGAASVDEHLPWEGGPAYYARWTNGLRSDPDFFPIAVWLQSPSRAPAYKAIGINLYVGLWKGPTAEQIAALEAAGMPVLAGQNEFALNASSRTIRGWTMMDEPDNAQPKPGGGYGPCVFPPLIAGRAAQMRAADGTRPVYLNLGQGVANRTYKGRGSECGRHDEHYPEYARAADIVSYDIYPVNSGYPLWWVGDGIDRLRQWTGYRKPVWNWIEASSIRGNAKPSPAQIRSEVWMSIIHGSMGIGYFCHQFQPKSDEAAPLHDPDTKNALATINAQITSLARVLNTRSLANGVAVSSSNEAVPVDTMVKRSGGATYLFAIGARPGETTATFRLRGVGDAKVEVLGEGRTVQAKGGVFRDRFGEYEVHLYRAGQ
jgi:hypothetical protein